MHSGSQTAMCSHQRIRFRNRKVRKVHDVQLVSRKTRLKTRYSIMRPLVDDETPPLAHRNDAPCTPRLTLFQPQRPEPIQIKPHQLISIQNPFTVAQLIFGGNLLSFYHFISRKAGLESLLLKKLLLIYGFPVQELSPLAERRIPLTSSNMVSNNSDV